MAEKKFEMTEKSKILNEVVLKYIEALQKNDIEEKGRLFNEIWKNVEKFCAKVLYIYYPTFMSKQDFCEDMMQEAVMKILECCRSYDVSKACFITYCKKPVVGAGRECINKRTGISAYYANCLSKIRRAENQCKMVGDKITVKKIKEITKLSEKTINKVYGISKINGWSKYY